MADASIATSAAALPDGRAAVDLVVLDTPHRVELILDPATATFSATWPVLPLFLAGVEKQLAAMRAPA